MVFTRDTVPCQARINHHAQRLSFYRDSLSSRQCAFAERFGDKLPFIFVDHVAGSVCSDFLLPDRDYYLSTAPQMAALRDIYRGHIEAMLRLAGFIDAPLRAARVFSLETAMAKVHTTLFESEDVHAPVSWTRAELPGKAPGLDRAQFLDAASLKTAPVFIIWHPKAIAGLSALTVSQPLDAWRDWLAFHTIEDEAAYLPKAFVVKARKPIPGNDL